VGQARLKPYLLLAVLLLGTGLGIGLGLAEAPPLLPLGVNARLVLDNARVVVGHDVTGWIIFQNGGRPVEVNAPGTCLPGPDVFLTNQLYKSLAAVGACSTGTFTIPPGITRRHFIIATRDAQCGLYGGEPAIGLYCFPPDTVKLPLLATGEYLVAVRWNPPFQALPPSATPVPVTLVNAPRNH